jgi:acetyl-CoA carboxylase biotin carboxylase subunit
VFFGVTLGKGQHPAGFAGPGFKGPFGEFGIARLAAGSAGGFLSAGVDPVSVLLRRGQHQQKNQSWHHHCRYSTRVFTKILIANRGEISLRVIRTLREMGIRSVAVYTDVDRAALHVRKADEAARIESYLNMEAIIEAARRHGADAIHPGYGFLSENARFAQACHDAGMTFIGPSARSIELMGSKTEARRVAAEGGAPIVPSGEAAGYPVMLKAVAGGGGKGMRRVDREEDLASAREAASSEAMRAFGDGRIYIEKLIENARHIEIQVLGDMHGNMVHLGERECSVQRRHQKVIEESPSPLVTLRPELRQRMGEAAIQAAKAAGYYNAGTVEFLADNDGNFYFLEMNTRLQVEHPVTELVTGLDLVRLQIDIAAGARLPFAQEDVVLRGAAIECRIYAEDPANNFFPSPGKILQLAEPSGPGVRLDSGIYPGWTVPIDYDPMLSKLIVWADTREHAIERMLRALGEYHVGGIRTNISLFQTILNDPAFRTGDLHTGYLDALLKAGIRFTREAPAGYEALAGEVAARRKKGEALPVVSAESNWRALGRLETMR